MSKREELIREYCRQVNESLHFIQKYMEGIVPAGRCSEELYWETKKISEELQKSNQGEPLAEEVCGWLLAQETADVQKVRSGQSLEVAREIYPAVQRKRA